jgi:hypothetical protein
MGSTITCFIDFTLEAERGTINLNMSIVLQAKKYIANPALIIPIKMKKNFRIFLSDLV